MKTKPKIGIVTPLRNEIQNIEKLFRSIEDQTLRVHYWVIIENDSKDGSIEKLNKIKKTVKNVEKLEIYNSKASNPVYELGVKYATLINTGFEKIKNNGIIDDLDFIVSSPKITPSFSTRPEPVCGPDSV